MTPRLTVLADAFSAGPYRAALRTGANLSAYTSGSFKAGAATFNLTYEICDADHLDAEVATTIVAYNLDAGRPRRFADSSARSLTRYSDF
ncbi:hypothetical protein FGW37_29910 [Streptomyces rectiverticillatus]|uniref:hypothetical protein n=1 Tax=Streptomyces rectiverticillatus TaxID=173860 RepID=UPI0015C3EF61|nr:hypothetical protein [Streptomyces rectiverticillatus]QLE75252.1 hypothetical protein FGW37_29910 [Streptomyces rectiverticillatus]